MVDPDLGSREYSVNGSEIVVVGNMNANTDARLDSKSGICFKKQGSPYYTIDLGSTIDLYGIQMAGHATVEAWRYDVQLKNEYHNVVLFVWFESECEQFCHSTV